MHTYLVVPAFCDTPDDSNGDTRDAICRAICPEDAIRMAFRHMWDGDISLEFSLEQRPEGDTAAYWTVLRFPPIEETLNAVVPWAEFTSTFWQMVPPA